MNIFQDRGSGCLLVGRFCGRISDERVLSKQMLKLGLGKGGGEFWFYGSPVGRMRIMGQVDDTAMPIGGYASEKWSTNQDRTNHRRPEAKRHHQLRPEREPSKPPRGRRPRRHLQHLAPVPQPGPVLGAPHGFLLLRHGMGRREVSEPLR